MRQEADFDPRVFEDRLSDDAKTYVRFYINSVADQVLTEAQGRPIFRDMEYVEIRTPGNQTNIVNRPVSMMDKQRFPRHYAMFKQGLQDVIVGQPLSEVAWILRSQVDELKFLKVLTVEQLASVNDDLCSRVPGMLNLKNRAQRHLDESNSMSSLLERIKELEAKLATPEPEEE